MSQTAIKPQPSLSSLPMTPPKPPEAKPQPLAVTPPTRAITLVKPPNGPWKATFTGPVRMKDINYLRRFLSIEYLRSKRRGRLAKITSGLPKAPKKESQNG